MQGITPHCKPARMLNNSLCRVGTAGAPRCCERLARTSRWRAVPRASRGTITSCLQGTVIASYPLGLTTWEPSETCIQSAHSARARNPLFLLGQPCTRTLSVSITDTLAVNLSDSDPASEMYFVGRWSAFPRSGERERGDLRRCNMPMEIYRAARQRCVVSGMHRVWKSTVDCGG